jgi:hypothetical protein
MSVHLRDRDDLAPQPIPVLSAFTGRLRVPGRLWNDLGWNAERERNIAADIERGVYPYNRKHWFTSDGKAA